MTGRVVDMLGLELGIAVAPARSIVSVEGYLPLVLVRLVKEEIQVGDNFEVAISVYWVTDSVEHCRVGFLPRFMIPYADSFNGLLAQVADVFDESVASPSIRKKVHHNHGFCNATIFDLRIIK